MLFSETRFQKLAGVRIQNTVLFDDSRLVCGLCRRLTGGIFFRPFLYRNRNERIRGREMSCWWEHFWCFLVHDSAMCKVGMLITDSGTGHTGCVIVGYIVCRKCVNNSCGSKIFLFCFFFGGGRDCAHE